MISTKVLACDFAFWFRANFFFDFFDVRIKIFQSQFELGKEALVITEPGFFARVGVITTVPKIDYVVAQFDRVPFIFLGGAPKLVHGYIKDFIRVQKFVILLPLIFLTMLCSSSRELWSNFGATYFAAARTTKILLIIFSRRSHGSLAKWSQH